MDFTGCVLLAMSVMTDICIVLISLNIPILIPCPPLAYHHSEIILTCAILLMLIGLTVTVYFFIHKTYTDKKVVSRQPDPGTMSL